MKLNAELTKTKLNKKLNFKNFEPLTQILMLYSSTYHKTDIYHDDKNAGVTQYEKSNKILMLAAAGMFIISDWSFLLSTLCVTFQVDNMQFKQPCWFHSTALMFPAAERLTVPLQTLPLCNQPSCCMLTETKTVKKQKQNNHTDLKKL